MRKTVTAVARAAAIGVVAMVVIAVTGTVVAALDCAKVQELKKGGARPSEIAQTLGLTTPDVQACLAGVVEEPEMANPPSKLPLAPQRPSGDGPIRRSPDGQSE